jgi:hypothetical protein
MTIRGWSCSGLTVAVVHDHERWLEVVGRGASQEVGGTSYDKLAH